MQTYSEREVFPQYEQLMFQRATRVVGVLPDTVNGQELRCHEVARIVAYVLGVGFVDGRYEIGAEHSWCTFVDSPHILDVYTVGRLPPVQLVAVVPTMPARYTPGPRRDDIRELVVERLTKHVHRTLMWGN